MPIKFKCPTCQTIKQAPDTMAGSKAKCDCGQVLKIPGTPSPVAPAAVSPAASTSPLIVACPACGKQHQAPASMAGQQAQCDCGALVMIPHVGGAAADPYASNPLGSSYPTTDPLAQDPYAMNQTLDQLAASEAYQPPSVMYGAGQPQAPPEPPKPSEDELLQMYASSSSSADSEYMSAMVRTDNPRGLAYSYGNRRRRSGINGGRLIGGLAMLILGPVVFVAVLAAGWIWPYPLILSVIGLFTIVSALMGGE